MIPGRPSVTLGTTDTLANNTQPTIVVLQISRDEIEACYIASVLERLLVLIDSPENVMLYRESLTFVITGFDDDQRELPEIPEVRAYFKRLVTDWPHWLWFLVRGSGVIPVLMACLCDIAVHRSEAPGVYFTEFIDPEQVQRVLFDLIGRGNALFMAMNISFVLADESLETALNEVVGAIG